MPLVEPFLALGVLRQDVTFGHTLEDECRRLGIEVGDSLDQYDDTAAQPFPGVHELVDQLDRWAVCSKQTPRAGRAELLRLGWTPEVALFADGFAGPKQLGPVLDALALDGEQVLFVGDTDHDRRCAAARAMPIRPRRMEQADRRKSRRPDRETTDGRPRLLVDECAA